MDDAYIFPSALSTFQTSEAQGASNGFPCVGAACKAAPQSHASPNDLVPLYGGELVGVG